MPVGTFLAFSGLYDLLGAKFLYLLWLVTQFPQNFSCMLSQGGRSIEWGCVLVAIVGASVVAHVDRQ